MQAAACVGGVTAKGKVACSHRMRDQTQLEVGPEQLHSRYWRTIILQYSSIIGFDFDAIFQRSSLLMPLVEPAEKEEKEARSFPTPRRQQIHAQPQQQCSTSTEMITDTKNQAARSAEHPGTSVDRPTLRYTSVPQAAKE